jgi:hypothetical protein
VLTSLEGYLTRYNTPMTAIAAVKFCERSRGSRISISPAAAFPLVHLALQSMICLHHPLSSLIGGASGRLEGYEGGMEQSHRHGLDGPVKASPAWILIL